MHQNQLLSQDNADLFKQLEYCQIFDPQKNRKDLEFRYRMKCDAVRQLQVQLHQSRSRQIVQEQNGSGNSHEIRSLRQKNENLEKRIDSIKKEQSGKIEDIRIRMEKEKEKAVHAQIQKLTSEFQERIVKIQKSVNIRRAHEKHDRDVQSLINQMSQWQNELARNMSAQDRRYNRQINDLDEQIFQTQQRVAKVERATEELSENLQEASEAMKRQIQEDLESFKQSVNVSTLDFLEKDLRHKRELGELFKDGNTFEVYRGFIEPIRQCLFDARAWNSDYIKTQAHMQSGVGRAGMTGLRLLKAMAKEVPFASTIIGAVKFGVEAITEMKITQYAQNVRDFEEEVGRDRADRLWEGIFMKMTKERKYRNDFQDILAKSRRKGKVDTRKFREMGAELGERIVSQIVTKTAHVIWQAADLDGLDHVEEFCDSMCRASVQNIGQGEILEQLERTGLRKNPRRRVASIGQAALNESGMRQLKNRLSHRKQSAR